MEFLNRVKDYFLMIISNFITSEGIIYSTYISFYLVMSVFPFLLATIGIVALLPFSADEFVLKYLNVFPQEAKDIIVNFINNVKNESGYMLIYSSVFALWSSSKAVRAIQIALDKIYGNNDNKNFILAKIFSVLINFLFVLMLILVSMIPLIISVAEIIIEAIVGDIFVFDFIRNIQWLFMFFSIMIVVVFFYTRLSSRKLKVGDVIPGSLFTTIGWIIASAIFNKFFKVSSKEVYGAISVFVLLSIWFQINAIILLLGAHINKHYEHIETK